MYKKCNFEIGDRVIGETGPAFIIAEVGINHNGSLTLAKECVKAAKDSGADCVKFQLFHADEFMSDVSVDYTYRSKGQTVVEDMKTMFKRVELSLEDYKEISSYAKELDIIPLASAADPLTVDWVMETGGTVIKLASEDLINWRLLDYVNKKKMSVILSSGMADEWEVKESINHLKNVPVILCHCISVYPTPENEVNLRRMLSLRKYSQLVGFSDHTDGVLAAIGAVAMGAVLVEKHFTLDRNLPGPDHSMSADPGMLSEYIKAIRDMEVLLGGRGIMPSETEKELRKQFRRSIVAKSDLPEGHVIALSDIAFKRPHIGIHPFNWKEVVGSKTKNAIRKDSIIKLLHLEM
jgi:N,N'-diacetyllegionaminate synthase